MSKITIFWFRRDLRLNDNAGLYDALRFSKAVLPLFIFDSNILEDLDNKKDARVSFIYDEVKAMKKELEEMGSSLLVRHGKPLEVWRDLINEFDIEAVFTNRDYEPYATKRDSEVKQLLRKNGNILFNTFKDHVIFEKEEVLKDDGDPYVVFTPYSKKWKELLFSKVEGEGSGKKTFFYFKAYPTEQYFDHFFSTKAMPFPSLGSLGFEPGDIPIPAKSISQSVIRKYGTLRDYPAKEGTSRLGIHFRFGTISIREKAAKALDLSESFLNELIWRDFYSMILAHFPHTVNQPFYSKYQFIKWRNVESEFEKWCEGKTGYPIVDAGMRQLNTTGYMHNRVRMVTASFLTKHLLIDWRWGEAYFAGKLLDYDLSSNVGGWQWAAGCGTDAAPYFRIFNPEAQQKKFDKNFEYIKKYVPEYGTDKYPPPMVEHRMARERCLKAYKTALAKAET